MKIILQKISKNLKVLLKKKQKGQTLIEFLLILLTFVIISIFLVKTINGHIATRWKGFVRIIADPLKQKINL